MNKLARLVLVFSLSFIIIFLLAASLRFLSLRVDWAKSLPPKPETSLTLLIAAAHWALSLSLFTSILFALSYAARRNIFAPMAIGAVITVSFLLCFFISLALYNWKYVPPAETTGIQLGENGLILSNSLNRNETAVVLLKGTADPLGPRVIAIPGQPLLHHDTSGASFDLPSVPFGDDTPWFLKSLSIDIRLNAEMFAQKFVEGFFSFLLHAGALIILLCSLGYVIKMSAWPLANLFFGVLAFRGILALETFFYSPDMQEILGSFLKDMIPATLAVPLIFLIFGSLVLLYSFLVYMIKRRHADEY